MLYFLAALFGFFAGGFFALLLLSVMAVSGRTELKPLPSKQQATKLVKLSPQQEYEARLQQMRDYNFMNFNGDPMPKPEETVEPPNGV